MLLSNHPANLILRFVLEIVALVAVGQWGWRTGEQFDSTAARYALTLGLPLLMAVIWAVFRAPDDPLQSNAKHPIVPISSKMRLLLEVVFFGFAIWATFNNEQVALGMSLVVAVLMHYFWSAERVIRMLRRPSVLPAEPEIEQKRPSRHRH